MSSDRAVGCRHVPVHRYRGFDAAVGSRRGRDAGGARGPRRVCCGRRSKRTTAGCSSTPATGCARCSPHRGLPSMPRSPRSGALELPVRMGIATGEAELRDGDYFGAVLNRAARVMAAGHGGQILLDGDTAGLSLSRPDNLGRSDYVISPSRSSIFQIRAAGLRSDFPPLKTDDATPGNLRVPTTSLIGRETEIAELQDGTEAAPAGDSHRCRRCRQDPLGAGARRPVGARLIRTVCSSSSWPRSPTRRGA